VAPADRSDGSEPEALPAQRTFIVRLALGSAETVTGTVEHLRTGERRRFQGLEHLGPVISSMLGPAEADMSPGTGRPPAR
jgi:hypothetical protein